MFDKWNKKANELSKICTVSVSSLIEEKATNEERQNGFDLADYLVRFSSDFLAKQDPPNKNESILLSDLRTSSLIV